MSLIHNERTKLTATWINSVASGVTITGGAAPIVAAVLGMSGVAQVGFLALAASSVILAFRGDIPTFDSAGRPWEASTMNAVQIYGFYVAPLLLLAAGLGMYWWTGRGEHRQGGRS